MWYDEGGKNRLSPADTHCLLIRGDNKMQQSRQSFAYRCPRNSTVYNTLSLININRYILSNSINALEGKEHRTQPTTPRIVYIFYTSPTIRYLAKTQPGLNIVTQTEIKIVFFEHAPLWHLSTGWPNSGRSIVSRTRATPTGRPMCGWGVAPPGADTLPRCWHCCCPCADPSRNWSCCCFCCWDHHYYYYYYYYCC